MMKGSLLVWGGLLGVVLGIAGTPGLAQPVDRRVPGEVRPGASPQRRVQPDRAGASRPPSAVEEAKAEPSVRDAIGYTAARRRLRRAMPTGRGVPFGHVEGVPGDYAPKLEGAAYGGVAFSLASGPSATSGHATVTARFIYGDKGLAPGVEVVHCLTAGDFLGAKYLRADSPGLPPAAGLESAVSPRVFTHSWVGDPPPAAAQGVLRRLDHQVDVHDVVVVAGVNNGRQSPVPSWLATAYNALAVGSTSGQHSGGYTRFEVAGRCKPDLVAPRGLTSYATPVVAACAGLLLERADTLEAQGVSDAGRSEVIKAALMGGCTKPAGWAPDPGHPLDAWLGAGVVNIDRSLRILKEGALPAGEALKRRFGWSFVSLEPGAQAGWVLPLPAAPGPVTLAAVWHRRIDARQAKVRHPRSGAEVPVWLDTPRTADFDLKLVALDDTGAETGVAASASRVDNVEYLVVGGLAGGRYRIVVERQAGEEEPDERWDVALTWAIDLPQR